MDKFVIIKDEGTDDRDVIEDKTLPVVNKHLSSLTSQHRQVRFDQYLLPVSADITIPDDVQHLQ